MHGIIYPDSYLSLDEGRPLPGQISPLDTPDDYFRIRLICTLLDSCGMCFDRGSYMRKLDRFLTFFQVSLHNVGKFLADPL